jgi:hypothetical protein
MPSAHDLGGGALDGAAPVFLPVFSENRQRKINQLSRISLALMSLAL